MHNDDKIDKLRLERKRLKVKYRDLFGDILDILQRYDPVGIVYNELNPDEYEPEVGTILPRLREARSQEDTRRIVYEEFVRWFDVNMAGSEERYEQIAREIWSRLRQHIWAEG